jgi:hypothetical protein
VGFYYRRLKPAATLPYSIRDEDDIKKWFPIEEKVGSGGWFFLPKENQVV